VQRRLLDDWYSQESLRRACASQRSTFFVAECGGEVVGFAQYVRRSRESEELMRIYVLPVRQRGGIGTRLLGVALAEFAQEGLKRLTVSVERDNRIGRRFYEKSAFGESREHVQDVQGYALDLVEYRRPIP
jgi:GNAT superfamily N-acetyltransferase